MLVLDKEIHHQERQIILSAALILISKFREWKIRCGGDKN